MKDKKVLQITITPTRKLKTKFGRYLQHKWFVVWSIWRSMLMSKFYWGLWKITSGIFEVLLFLLIPKRKREKYKKDFYNDEEFDVVIIDKTKKMKTNKKHEVCIKINDVQ